MKLRTPRLAMGIALAATLFAASSAQAQFRSGAISLHGGARTYAGDSGEGSTVMVALRSEFPVSPNLLVEFSGSVADRVDEVPRSTASVFEAQLQLAIPLGEIVEPYVGAGVGLARVLSGFPTEREESEMVVSLGGGVRGAFSRELGWVADARVRGIGTELDASHADFSLGLRYQLR